MRRRSSSTAAAAFLLMAAAETVCLSKEAQYKFFVKQSFVDSQGLIKSYKAFRKQFWGRVTASLLVVLSFKFRNIS
jgi:hypothetical protein